MLGLAVGAADLEWQEAALCAQSDPETWFVEKGGTTAPAKEICRRCPVRSECLEYALANQEAFGVWGGLSELERRRLQHGRLSAASDPDAHNPDTTRPDTTEPDTSDPDTPTHLAA